MSLKTVKGNLLFWKISGVYTFLLIVLGLVYIGIASHLSHRYINEVHQQLYADIASHLAKSTHPFKNGKPDTLVTHDIIHSMMVVNPSAEIYLLDTAGAIIDYVVPQKTVKRKQVDLSQIKTFISGKSIQLEGDNPKQVDEKSIFSAAPIQEKGKTLGYVYVVLTSEKQKVILSQTNHHLYFNLGTSIFLLTLVITFIVGIITFFLITDSVCEIAGIVLRFKEGDYSARITGKLGGNLELLANTFNEMADVIVDNIKKITATDRLRQELIANVSHDLRTPLAIMQGYIETLIIKKNSIHESLRDHYLSVVWDSSLKLGKLIEQLFEYSKLEANQIQPEKEPFLLSELISDLVFKYQILAKEKEILLKLDIPNQLPLVFADIALTERVIQNLLDNALKFTPKGGEISIILRNQHSGIEIQIADTGIGIEEEVQVFIFERYKQLDDSNSTSHKGMGMGVGLAIVKKILDLHQVAIYVKSTPGKGTTFWFELPFARTNLYAGTQLL